MWLLVFLGAAFFGPQIISAQCTSDKVVYVGPGQVETVRSPGWVNQNSPVNYAAGLSCSWTYYADVGYKLIMTCPVVMIPQTSNCAYDKFIVNVNGYANSATDQVYCGTGTLTTASKDNMINLRLQTYTNNGGRFNCQITTQIDPCNCGRRKTTARIVGGTPSLVNEFPYQAMLTDASNNLICSATIINENYVLTAAHCVYNQDPSGLRVVVGEHDRSSIYESPYAAVYAVSSITRHASYSPSTSNNDIALVRTSSPIALNVGVGIACLPFKYANAGVLFDGASVVATGWGTVGYGEPLSPVLRKVNLGVINNGNCAASFPIVGTTGNNFICTYSPGKDTCQYDSGTNLYYQDTRVYTIGVTSSGQGCAGTKPTLNMRVTNYIQWILNNSPSATYCSV